MEKVNGQRILVTGAAGFIAHHLIKRLLSEGVHVCGLDNFDPFYDRRFKEDNLSELKSYAEASPGSFVFKELGLNQLPVDFGEEPIHGIIHLAAKAGVRPSLENPQAYFESNVSGTLKLLEFARAKGIKNILFGSSSSVYGNANKVPFEETDPVDNPISPYAASKKAGELICYSYAHLYGFNMLCLRFFTVYGRRQRPDLAIFKFMKKLLNDEEITLFGDGTTRRDYTYVEDIVDGVFRAYQWASQKQGCYEIFNLGRSQTVELLEMVQSLEKATGKKATIDWQPEQPGDVKQTFSDISKAREVLGYDPKTSLNEGVGEMVKWYTSQELR